MPDDSMLELERFGVGQPVPRTEDPRLLTGGGRYTDDYDVPGQAHAFFARSMVPHGRIMSVDISAAAAAPGVIAVYTGNDLVADGVGGLPCGLPFKSRDGSDMLNPPWPTIAADRVRYVGDAIAMVVAETLAQAMDAAELVEADIEMLPVLTDMTRARDADAPQLWDDVPQNTVLDWFVGDQEAADKAFAEAAHVTRLTLDNNRLVVNAMEPRAYVGEYDAAADKMTLHAGGQGAFGMRNTLAGAVFKVPPEKLRVIQNDVGGSFGMKGSSIAESVGVLYAARKLGRPVKWRASRSESFLSDQHGRASLFDAELALDADGNFTALKLTGYGDVGGALTAMGPAPATNVITRNISSVYKTPVVAISVKSVFTNTVPTGPYRGAGRPESKYMMERLIDQAARETGHDRIELRRRNLIPGEAMPFAVPVGVTYDSGDFPGILQEALEKADVAGFAARKAASASAGKLRGLGISPYLESTAPPGKELGDIRFEDDGTVTFWTGTLDFGQGHRAPFAQVLSAQLGIPFHLITIRQGDSDEVAVGGGTGGSRSAIATSGAIVEVSEAVIDKGKRVAGHILEAAVEDIEFDRGTFRVAGTDRALAILDLARELKSRTDLPDDLPDSLDTVVSHDTHPMTYPNGCHVCEVEIDPETGETEIVRYTVVDDFGVMINPLLVEGQVHGGVAQGIGQVLMEGTVYDGDGQLLTGSFMDYCMPRADDLVGIDFHAHPVPAKTNPLGVKGCGEAGNAGSLASAACAVLDALAERGVTDLGTPMTPHRIWQALRAVGGN